MTTLIGHPTTPQEASPMLSAVVETITPEIAEKYLLLNTENFRTPDHNRIAKYAQEMASGKWELNGEAIKFGDRALIDGQHRLMAIIKSGAAINSLVIRGVKTDGMSLDRGRPRKLSQWVTHQGVKNATHMCALAKYIIAYEKGFWGERSFRVSETPDSEIIGMIERNEDQMQNALRFSAGSGSILPKSILAAIVYISSNGIDPEDSLYLKWFVSSLHTGIGLDGSDAVLHLRNKLLSQKSGAMFNEFVRRQLATKAWNKTALGESCSAHSFRMTFTGPTKQTPISKIELAPRD